MLIIKGNKFHACGLFKIKLDDHTYLIDFSRNKEEIQI